MSPPKIKQLIHNGVLIPAYEPKGFKIRYTGKELKLVPEHEEMAVAWVKKLGTDYVKDPIFVRNFVKDFSKALGVETSSIEDFDFSEIKRWVDEEKATRESMSYEQRKAAVEARKKIREANKEKYGYATLNGERVEIGYTAEPSSIFMGRGKHPLRGKWKRGARYEDIILNLSPDAPTPTPPGGGHWKERVFDPDGLWVAKWPDKLSGELKYIWLADTVRHKQERDIEKFDRAMELEELIGKVRQHIEKNLASEDIKRRKVATVCWLIDNVKMRVGDEKDKDEADTIGATTLRGSHVNIDGENVNFDFLGKDSVRWVKTIKPPPQVVENLRSFIGKPQEEIFSGVRSEKVNAFLGEVMPELTAKVFRTYHSSRAVKKFLEALDIKPDDPEFKKKYAAMMANLEAAILCHHKRKLPKNWAESLKKKEERLRALKAQLAEVRKKPKSKMQKKRVESLTKRIEEAEVKVKAAQATRDYNLNTSLKSYIDPRHFVKWAMDVEYDWKKIYPKTLQQKFTWAEETSNQ
ncbi:MAG: DNA topoisomerase I [Candidatus Hadarchaeum sp.]|jgi:DNA topoisomerase-1|nr:DNA topoisomerase I [Candidatus Hadarchaeum sp.]